jgi:hypothetical protein
MDLLLGGIHAVLCLRAVRAHLQNCLKVRFRKPDVLAELVEWDGILPRTLIKPVR